MESLVNPCLLRVIRQYRYGDLFPPIVLLRLAHLVEQRQFDRPARRRGSW
ncbi:Uncharacterised protein [Vibrio cholerae]|nr:Uncharacterised protein [Vibrio cholerae]